MFSQNATRIKLLKIWEILCQETDEEHPMESLTLIEKLAEMGVMLEARTDYNPYRTENGHMRKPFLWTKHCSLTVSHLLERRY